MSLNLEWQHRVNNWRKELPNHFYRPLGTIPMAGFVIMQQSPDGDIPLAASEALQREYRPMPPGTRWGAKWEYGCFRGELTLPPEAAGQRIVLRADVGGESIVYVNGQAAGARDQQHAEITLAASGVPGTRYEVWVEAYAGHGPLVVGEGPVGYGRESVPEPGPTQAEVGESTFGIWNEEVYQLWLDVETLYHVRQNLDPDSLRVAEIDAGLRDFTLIADPELLPAEFLETVRAARRRLKPLLDCVNGSTAPTLFTVGHAHLDVAWLWPLQETERKMGRTIANQLALMAEYPEYKFLQSQAHLYYMLQQRYPKLYERVKAAVKAGQLIPEGGMWVEADTNIAGGESLIRQLIHGKRFFREEFGIECELLWLPDVFGYSGALPQIMVGCGIRYFATQKIFWTYNGGDPFPHNTFTWEGSDGSEVLAHIFNDYNSQTHPSALIERWKQRVQKDGISTMLVAFGWGDGGGGPTRDHIEFLRRAEDLEGVPRVRIASPVEFFKDQERRGIPPERYVGELYFQAHRGTYTSQARTKKNNRKAELALREAELWGTAAQVLGDRQGRPYTYPRAKWQEAWRTVLLHQFHDILPGSSIHRVYEEAEAVVGAVVESAQGMARDAAAALASGDPSSSPLPEARAEGSELALRSPAHSAGSQSKGQALSPCHLVTLSPSKGSDAVTVFNSLSWDRRALVPLPEGFKGAADAAGKPLPVQAKDGQAWAEVVVPSCGWTTVYSGRRARAGAANPSTSPRPEARAEGSGQAPLNATERLLENELLRVEFNDRGEITSIFDKETGREWAAGPCNSFKMYKDVPNWFDAWDIDSMYEQTPVELNDPATIEVVAGGPLLAALRVTRKLHNSAMTQEISLQHGARRVDFATTIDWQESHKLLKVAFPVNVHANAAIHEIQFGHLRRPNHRSRPFDANRFEVSNHKWSALAEENRGFAVLNDCKYGLNVLGNPSSIHLTLLKSALAPDATADQGIQAFTYAFYAWNGSLAESGVVCEAYELNCPAWVVPGAAGERSLFAVDAANVVIETVKPAEDGSDDVIVRLYEAKRMATRCALVTTLPVTSAAQTDMLENPQSVLPLDGGKIALDFRPFEIKTLRLRIS